MQTTPFLEQWKKDAAQLHARLLSDDGRFHKLAPVNASMEMAEAGAAQVSGLTVTQAASIYRAMILTAER